MPTDREHISLALHNIDVAEYLAKNPDHFDWVAISACYAALHIIEAVFCSDPKNPNRKHTPSHKELRRRPIGCDALQEHRDKLLGHDPDRLHRPLSARHNDGRHNHLRRLHAASRREGQAHRTPHAPGGTVRIQPPGPRPFREGEDGVHPVPRFSIAHVLLSSLRLSPTLTAFRTTHNDLRPQNHRYSYVVFHSDRGLFPFDLSLFPFFLVPSGNNCHNIITFFDEHLGSKCDKLV